MSRLKNRLFLFIGLVLFLLFCLSACSDSGHDYYLTVSNDYGTVYALWGAGTKYESKYEEPMFSLMDGKGVNRTLTFVAVPDDGYRVKEWRCNGKVYSTQSTLFYLPQDMDDNPEVYVSVEFEFDYNSTSR